MIGTDQALVRMPATTLAEVHRVLSSELEPSQLPNVLRRIGMETGGTLHGLFKERISGGGGDLGSDAFWSSLDTFFQDLGWGALEHERLHPGVISVASTDWFESSEHESGNPSCHFTVGVLGELFRQFASLEVAVMEVGCRSTGAKECRFLIGGPEALESVFQRITEGSHYREAVAGLG